MGKGKKKKKEANAEGVEKKEKKEKETKVSQAFNWFIQPWIHFPFISFKCLDPPRHVNSSELISHCMKVFQRQNFSVLILNCAWYMYAHFI